MPQSNPHRPSPVADMNSPRNSSSGARTQVNGSGGLNTLSEDVEILGTITFGDNLTIEGKVLGDVLSRGDLTIGERAFIKGNIKARSATIHGRVEGKIDVQERCEAAATANIEGDISAATFSIKEGASLTGRTRIGKAGAAPAPAAAKR